MTDIGMGDLLIRRAEQGDAPALAELYGEARAFMRETGNMTQWSGGHPDRDDVERDIAEGCLYTALLDGEIAAVFYFRIGDDPTYSTVYEGEWLSDSPYAVIHRVAVRRRGVGLAGRIFSWCADKHPHLRIDTHRDNLPMQRALLRSGFRRCGIIYLSDGSERLAYELVGE